MIFIVNLFRFDFSLRQPWTSMSKPDFRQSKARGSSVILAKRLAQPLDVTWISFGRCPLLMAITSANL